MHPQLFKQVLEKYQDKMAHVRQFVSGVRLNGITEWH
jgi:hypothetical protein